MEHTSYTPEEPIAAIATATIALHTVRGVLIFPFIVDFSCCGLCDVPLLSP